MDFNGQVAIVTGAGRGIGRSHALALAARGAAVVVNDVGAEIDGSGTDTELAGGVVEEIAAAGGKAVASGESVATADGGASLVAQAKDTFGHLDIVIHNAGIIKAGPIATQPMEDIRAVLDVHLLGGFHVVQPAWAEFVARDYGRIVLTASGAMFGHPMVHAYAAAKMGLVGLTRSLNQEALMSNLDLKVNALAPIGSTRMARDEQKARWGDLMDPDAVAAVALYLASRDCAVSGETFHGGGGHFCQLFLGQTRGWAKQAPGITPEDVAEHLEEAMALDGFRIPPNTNASTDFLHEVATGEASVLSGEDLPEEYRRLRDE